MGDIPENRPAPSATGTLEKTPLVHLLLYVLDKKLGGTIEFAAPDQRTAMVLFIGGEPAKARLSESASHLGRVLLELGHITEDQLTQSLAELAKAKKRGHALHGELLLAGAVIDRTTLEAGLREQLARMLYQIGSMDPGTKYAYYDGFDGLQDWGRPRTGGFDPLPMLWGMLRANPPLSHVDAGLARVHGVPLRLAPTADVGRLGLDKDERAAVERLRERPMPAAELVSRSGVREREARLLVYLLLATKQVDVLQAHHGAEPRRRPSSSGPPSPRSSQRPPASSRSPSAPTPSVRSSPVPASASAPPRSLSPPQPSSPSHPPHRSLSPSGIASPAPDAIATAIRITKSRPPRHSGFHHMRPPAALARELAERWGEIVDRAATIDRADYFTMLDLARDATQPEIESAFFALAKKWHPDTLPPELAPVRDACSRVFARMSEAHSTLSDEKQHTQYMRLLADGSGTPEIQETVAKVVEAATDFQKAEVCFKRSDYAQAENLCRKALSADPSQPDYHAMLAWLIALKPESQTVEKTTECIQTLDRAISMSDRCERAYFWRGLLQKRLGKNDAAIRDFRRAYDLNPHNIDAAREVRLHRMRGGSTSTSPPPVRRTSPVPPKPGEPAKPGIFGKLFKKP